MVERDLTHVRGTIRGATGASPDTSWPHVLLYDRDDGGAPVAIEVVTAAGWSDVLRESPPDDADVRVVLLRAGRPPDQLPWWLGVELVPAAVGETGPTVTTYARLAPPSEEATARRVATRLLAARARPTPTSTLAEFLAAGAMAVRHPAPVPAESERRQGVLVTFCRGRGGPLGEVAQRTGLALEWWLARRFGTPDAFAEAILLERVRVASPELGAALEAVRGAEFAPGSAVYAELALDRQALLAQATPWRYLEGTDVSPALAALRAWLRRYRVAFEAHADVLRARVARRRAELERELRAVRALERLDSVRALGEPVGTQATVALRAVLDEFAAFEPSPSATPLGVEPALFERAEVATSQVHIALERQRERLAAITVRAVLDRPGTEGLDRLLQAFQATDLDGIERALDARLAAYIDELFGAAALTP